MKKIFLFLSFYFLFLTLIYPQWKLQSPMPTGNQLNSVYFTNSNHGWAVGNKGTILKYDGINWEQQISSTSNNLKSVFFINETNGWAVGDSGIILKYNGNQWILENSGTSNFLSSVFFIDENNGWAVGRNGTILYFNGNQWVNQQSGTSKSLTSIYAIDQYNVWAVGESGTIIKYDGSIWTFQSTGSQVTITSVYFLDKNNGRAVGYVNTGNLYGNYSGVILKFNGTNWITEASGLPILPTSVNFTYANNGWIAGAYGQILKFENNLWTSQISNTSENLNSIFFTNPNTGWAVGSRGEIVKFNGYIWNSQSNPRISYYNLMDINICNDTIGWVVGMGASDSQGSPSSILLNYNGNKWSIQKEISWSYLYSVCPISSDNLYLFGENYGKILYYNGTNISQQLINETLLYGFFLNPNNGWAVGPSGVINHFDGSNWNKVNSGTNFQLGCLFFTDSINGWTLGFDNINFTSILLKYNGQQWATIFTNTPFYPISSIYFIDSNIGWATSNYYYSGNNQILKTNDGGISWTIQMNTTIQLNKIFFIDSNHGWAVGNNGTIFKYDGISWAQQVSGTNVNLNSVYFKDSQNGWVIGENGTILNTQNGGVTGILENTNMIMNQIVKVFPNPFNQTTTISYQINKKENVSLKIFDISGKLVSTIVNSIQEKGDYNISFNGDNMRPGVYFYKFETIKTIESGKIIKF